MPLTLTVNYQFPKPDEEANVDEEFFRLQLQTLDLIDAAIFQAYQLAAGKAAASHQHNITDIIGLADILENKMPANRTFSLDDLQDVTGATDAANGYLLVKTATGYLPRSPAAVLGAHQHAMADIVGLDEALSSKLDTADFESWKEDVDDAIANSVSSGAVMAFFRATAPVGWLKANGAAIFRLDYAALDAAIYVGDALNATATAGYRCTDPANPDGTRSIAGDYLVLPDLRAEIVRGLDDGRGVDSGRELGSWQDGALQLHSHKVDPPSTRSNTDTHNHYLDKGRSGGWGGQYSGPFQNSGVTDDGGNQNTSNDSHYHTVDIEEFDSGETGENETRMRNVALLYCIKY